MKAPQAAVSEMDRVTRAGDTAVAATIHDLGVSHHPMEADFIVDAARTQIAYWKPGAVGEIVFNWFDKRARGF